MSELGGPLFHLENEGPEESALRATDYCRGPWSLETLHGGPVVGLLARAAERAANSMAANAGSPLQCSRLTVEMHQSVPLDLLTTRARVVKPGRRTVVIDSEILHGNTRVARASSQWLLHDPNATPHRGGPTPPPRPATSNDPRAQSDFAYPDPGYNCDTSELRYARGSHETEGPGTTWLRLASPLVADEDMSPFVMAATVSDLVAATGWEPSVNGNSNINPDVSLHMSRYPVGAWLCIDAEARHGGGGTATMTADLFDDHGWFGGVFESLVEVPMDPDAANPG